MCLSMEPLREKISELRIAQSGCMVSPICLGRGSNQSLSPDDKSCEEVGNVSEVDRMEDEAEEFSALNFWKPVSEYLLSEKDSMRITEDQTSEASNIDDYDDMEWIESGMYSVDSWEASKIPTIRHPTLIIPSLAELAAIAAGIPWSDFNPDIPVEGVPNDSSCKNRTPGDLKRKDTYKIFTEESSKDMSINDGGDRDGNQISTEVEDQVEAWVESGEMAKNVLCVNISRFTPSSVIRAVAGDKMLPEFEIYPQALLLIPDVNNPDEYIATLKIVNNSAKMLAYNIYLNIWAKFALLIESHDEILAQYSEVAIQIRSKSCNIDILGGVAQSLLVDDAILEIRSIDVSNIANQRQLSKLWRMAEYSFHDSVSSVKIRCVKDIVLEPRNKRIIEMSGEKRVQKFWPYVQHIIMDSYLDWIVATTYLVALYFVIQPWLKSCFDTPDPPPDPCDS